MANAVLDIATRTRRVDCGSVNLIHRHRRLEHPARSGGVGELLGQLSRRDLRGVTPAISAPTECAGFAAVVYDRVPISIGFGLTVCVHLRGKPLVW